MSKRVPKNGGMVSKYSEYFGESYPEPTAGDEKRHREWFKELGCTYNEWRMGLWKKYEDEGAFPDPAKRFGLKASYFAGRRG